MSLSETKLNIQNTVIVVAIAFVFGTVGVGFFTPDLITGSDGTMTAFQQSVLDNSGVLVIMVIAGAIVAIKLDKRDPQSEALVKRLIDALATSSNNPEAIK